MGRRDIYWQILVLSVGFGLAALAGFMVLPKLGGPGTAVWAGYIAAMFLVSYGANRLQFWLIRPPFSPARSVWVGAVAFVPMFLVYFPGSPFVMEVASKTCDMASLNNWILAAMMFGLLAPGGAVWLRLEKVETKDLEIVRYLLSFRK
jgi:hypothetical protein